MKYDSTRILSNYLVKLGFIYSVLRIIYCILFRRLTVPYTKSLCPKLLLLVSYILLIYSNINLVFFDEFSVTVLVSIIFYNYMGPIYSRSKTIRRQMTTIESDGARHADELIFVT